MDYKKYTIKHLIDMLHEGTDEAHAKFSEIYTWWSCNEPKFHYTFSEAYNDFLNQRKKENKTPNLYLLTLTLTEKSAQQHDIIETVERYINTLSIRKGLQLTKLSYVMEYTKKGVPHWHLFLETKINLTKRHFKIYIDNFGNIDLSLSKTSIAENIEFYMSKTGGQIITLI